MSNDERIRYGIHPLLEAEANELIFGSLRGETSQSAKKDILTPWKEADRRSREILAVGGTVDPQLRKGIYGRARNDAQPHLNSCDGAAPAMRMRGLNGGDDYENDGWVF